MSSTGAGTLLRDRDEGSQRVTFIELFFDLVYVFAITQLAHLLSGHLTALGAAQTLLMLLAVWRAWIDMAWVTNWLDPDRSPVRLLLVAVMLLSLIMSSAIPQAFGARGLVFAGAFVAMQVGKPAFVVAAVGSDPPLRRNFQRILIWCAASGVLWLAGGVATSTAREALWLAAVATDYAAPAMGFVTPGLGRSHTTDWTIAGGHLAERCQLFLIIALGESILDTGASFADLSWTAIRVTAFTIAFAGTVALWWIYFYRSAEGGLSVIASSADPGRLGRSAYTYFHLPMVAGVIVFAVGAERTVAQPDGSVGAALVAIVLGGPALYLAGHALFKHSLSGSVPVSHAVGIAILAALTPLGIVSPPVLLALAATLVLVGVACWDTWIGWSAQGERRGTGSGSETKAVSGSLVQ
jgi:low temperature requirement protein LtrA